MRKTEIITFDFLRKLDTLTYVNFDLGLLICYDVFNHNETKSSELKYLCKVLSDCDAQIPTQLTV